MMTLNVCQAGHTFHESKQVETEYGPMHIWDWPQYMDFPGYCTGQDEVSKSIDLQQVWERADSAHFRKVLIEQPGVVLDFGSHIGWFSVLAGEAGCPVWAVEADPQNVTLLSRNMADRFASPWLVVNAWAADVSLSDFSNLDDVRVMKVDIEGHEHEALNLTRHLWQQRKIDFGLWELSPIFENREGINSPSYADLVDEIASYGYRWYILKGDDRWYIEGKDLTFPQENGWCEKI